MYKKCPCGKDNCSCPTDIALFLVRLALAAVFIVHGFGKFANMEATIGYFSALGLPSVLAYLVPAIELLGGIAMLLGIGTTAAGVGLAIVMIGAIIKVHWAQGFSGGFEFPLTLLLSALAIGVGGPGCISISKLLKGKETQSKKSKSSKSAQSTGAQGEQSSQGTAPDASGSVS